MWVNKLSIFLVAITFLTIVFCIPASGREITVDDNGSADYILIQEAVNSSSSGDTIIVYPGFYNESLDIVIDNISVLSESEHPEDTAVRAFNISANNTTVNGFRINEELILRGHKSDFWYDNIANCTVKNNILESGIVAGSGRCYNSSIEKNVILNSGIHVYDIDEPSDFLISDNLVVNGDIIASHVYSNCILLNNSLLNGGIGVSECYGCNILNNYISNGTFNGYGIVFTESSNEVQNNTIINCTYGVFLGWLTGNNEFYNNTLTSNGHGIYAGESGGNVFSNNTISKNNIGISFEGHPSDNLITGNRIELNRQYGIYVKLIPYGIHEEPYNGTLQIYNNIFNNNISFFNDTGNYTDNYYAVIPVNNGAGVNSIELNTTKTPGPNILGGGPYLGGNYWAKPDGTGFSQNCNDWNGDGIGDSVYTVNAYDIDCLPLVSTSEQDQPVFPVADFSSNVTGGYVPFSVLFTDDSQNSTSRVWDFDNDGVIDSTDKTAVYVYPVSGAYTVNLTVNNANGTSSKLYPITASDRPQYTLTEAQITTNKSNQTSPAIYGDNIVFFDDQGGHYNIYVYNLSTSRESQITFNDTYYNTATGPAIYGDRVVWQEYRSTIPGVWDKADIHMYNLSTSTEIQITDSGQAFCPDIYGDRIVWTDIRNGKADIYIYDLSTSKETRITTNESYQGDPSIYGDKVVWQDSRNGDGHNPTDIYMYDLSTSREIQITDDDSDQYSPDIYGDRIVWADWRNRGWDIYMYNISTSRETRITIDKGSQEYPAIYGDKIAWVDSRNNNPDIYIYDLSTHVETRITSNNSAQLNPAIYGDRIVWTDCRNEYKQNDHLYVTNKDIYMCTVSEAEPSLKAPVADFSANTTSGNSPLKVLFADRSTGEPVYWLWDFGDGIYSRHALNATHTFTKPGKYDVSLTVTNENSSNTKTIPEYITVSAENHI